MILTFCTILLWIQSIFCFYNWNYTLIVYDSEINDLSNRKSVKKEILNLLNILERNEQLEFFDVNEVSNKSKKINYANKIENQKVCNNMVILPISMKNENNNVFLAPMLLEYLETKSNILVVQSLDGVLPKGLGLFLNQLGIYPAPNEYKYYDNFNRDQDGVRLTGDNNLSDRDIVESLDLIYRGVTSLIEKRDLLKSIVRGSSTSYTSNKQDAQLSKSNTWGMGPQIQLGVCSQTQVNSRMCWMGSDSLLALDDIIDWVFQKKNILKIQFSNYTNSDSVHNSSIYKVKDKLLFRIGLSQKVGKKWLPYSVKDHEKLQLEFTMLDPYYRLNLTPVGPVSSGYHSSDNDSYEYMTSFTIPDKHGVFKMSLSYNNPSYSFLSYKKLLTIRHLANDEYKRSWNILNSRFYLLSSTIVIATWFLFVFSFVYISNKRAENVRS